MIRIRRAVLALASLLAAFLAGQEVARPIPRIDWGDLPAEIAAKSPEFKTGYLVVPERRPAKPAGRTIRLPFIVMKSRSASPRPDPVLYMAGGPGGSTLSQVMGRRNSPLRDDRDLILLEQRGTRFAEPALMCPRIDAALRSGWGTRLNGDPDPRDLEAALASCVRSQEESGIGLDGYTTKESAADVADLKRLLGIGSWNLYGVSYSTKLMLTVLRDHPEGVRAAILDSVLPPEANWDEEGAANIVESLDRLLALCAEDELLRSRFPDLGGRFYRFLDQVDRRPLEVGIKNPLDGTDLALRLDGAGVMNGLYAGLEDASAIPDLPLIIDGLCRGEAGRLAPLARNYLGSSQGSAKGMRLSVWCNEEFPFESEEKILKPAGVPSQLSRFVQTAVPIEARRIWPPGRPEARENEPVRSDVPVLIAMGEFDPDTPPKWARAAAAFLPKSQLVEFAGYTHVPLFSHPEAARIMREFLADPSRPPDPGRAAVRPDFRLSWED